MRRRQRSSVEVGDDYQMSLMRRNVTVVSAFLVSAACGTGGPDTTEGLATETLASGLTMVVNTGGGAWTDADRWHASVGLLLGGSEGEGPELFGAIGAVAADEDGNLYVIEYLEQEIRVFDSTGAHLRTFGRSGQGPGEMLRASGLTFDGDGNLWAWDTGNRRFAVFTREGEFIRTVPRLATGVQYPWPGRYDEREGLIDWGLDRPGSAPGQVGSLAVSYPQRVDPVDGTLDTLPPLQKDYVIVGGQFRQPFAGILTTALNGRGEVWYAHTERYEIFKRGLLGDTLFALTRRDVRLQPVSSHEVDSVLAVYAQISSARAALTADDFSPTKPVIKRMLVDGLGHLLVMVDLDGEEIGSVVDVFEEANGRYLGPVELPVVLETNPRPFAAPGSLYGMVKGEYDVPEVVRIDFRIGDVR